jgi:hypothetical protein
MREFKLERFPKNPPESSNGHPPHPKFSIESHEEKEVNRREKAPNEGLVGEMDNDAIYTDLETDR